MTNDFTMDFEFQDTDPLDMHGAVGICIQVESIFQDKSLQPLASNAYGTRVQKIVYNPYHARWKRTEHRINAHHVDLVVKEQFPTWKRTGSFHWGFLIMVEIDRDPGVLDLVEPILIEERARMYDDLAQLDTAITEARRLDRDRPL